MRQFHRSVISCISYSAAIATTVLILAPAAAEASWLPGWGSSDGTPGVDDSWCFGAGYKLYVGDFDGNGRSDLLCHNSSSGQRRIDFQYDTYRGLWGTNWDSYTDGAAVDDWCSESGEVVHVGDFNGDGRDDLLCRVRGGFTNAGRKQIDFADADGHLDHSDFDTLDYNPAATQNWCTSSGESVFVGDFNNDGKDDLMCRVGTGYTNAGRKRVDYANNNGTFFGTEWDTLGNGSVEQSWCTAAGESVYVGDFNGDGKDDLLCHIAIGNTNAGRRRVDFAGSGTTLFAGTDWSSADGGGAASSWCATTGDVLNIADVNGDEKEDLVCVNKIDGGYATRVDHANNVGSFYGTNGQTHEEDWCLDSAENVHVGDFDGDGHGDTLCHDTTTGYRAIRYANSVGDFHSICSEDSVKGDGELPSLPVHFTVITDPENTDVTQRQTFMPTATSSHVHPMDGSNIDNPTEYFSAEVWVMNHYTKTYYPWETGVSVGDDYILYEYESHTLYDDIEGQNTCPDVLDWGNTASEHYSANCWDTSVLDESCFPNLCDGPYQDAGDAWNFGFACAIRTCEDPQIHKPHTLNVMVMDRCAWDNSAHGINDGTCRRDLYSMSFGLGGSDFFTAWDYERMLRGPDVASLLRDDARGVEPHELGHVLGLGHTGDFGDSVNAMDYPNLDSLSDALWRAEGYSEDIHELDADGIPKLFTVNQPDVMVTAARAKVVEWSCN